MENNWINTKEMTSDKLIIVNNCGYGDKKYNWTAHQLIEAKVKVKVD